MSRRGSLGRVARKGQRAVGARASTSVGTSINNNTFTTMTLGTVVHDTDGCFASNVYTVKYPGLYQVGGKFAFGAGGGWGAGEQQVLKVVKNGSTTVGYLYEHATEAAHTGYVSGGGTLTAVFAAGDTIELQIYQNSGAALALNADALSNYMDVAWIGTV